MDCSRRQELCPLKSDSLKQHGRVKSGYDTNQSIGSESLSNQEEEHKNYLTKPMASHRQSTRAWASNRLAKLKKSLSDGVNFLLVVAVLLAAIEAQRSTAASVTGTTTTGDNQHQAKAALEAELNSLLQQHDGAQDDNSKALSEAIISRLMLGNLSDVNLDESNNDLDGATPVEAQQTGGELEPELTGAEAMRLRKVISFLRNFELSQSNNGLNNGQVFNQFPVLPASQAATIKRASVKVGNYLRQQQQQPHGPPRQISTYGRNTFDFGLGKRPDASVAGNILRYGDSGIPISGGFGKRPSAHRYDFGLGKRVASPAYPRYDFGLGKRAPNRIRYDFGLGKR